MIPRMITSVCISQVTKYSGSKQIRDEKAKIKENTELYLVDDRGTFLLLQGCSVQTEEK